MDKTAAPLSLDPPPVVRNRPPKPGGAGGASLLVRRALTPLASLRLTVVLMALSIVLVFVGTLAQVDNGIWTVVKLYFRSAAVWVPFQVFFPRSLHVPGGFPFPGGWLLGGLLLVNLLAAHAVRFKLNWKRSGILLIHAGLIVMMLSELVTGLYAIEGEMTIRANGASNYLEHRHAPELAIVDPADPKVDDVVVIPQRLLRKGDRIHNDLLPFDVEVVQYMANSSLLREVPADRPNPATAGAGRSVLAVERPEVSGTDPEQTIDLPSAYVTLRDKQTGAALGTYLVSLWLYLGDQPDQTVAVGGQTYEISLRFQRTYKPYTLHLLRFTHEKYLGTDTPKNFASLIRVVDPVRGDDREVLIYMNSPMRYQGETFYQASFLPGDTGTILQVVRNPGWLMPYVSCAMVSLGMVIHFGLHLIGFLRRRVTP